MDARMEFELEITIPNDDVFISRLLERDETSYFQLVSCYYGLMKVIADAIVGEKYSEEVVQEAWVQVIKSLPTFKRSYGFKIWILTIVSNCALKTKNKNSEAYDSAKSQTILNDIKQRKNRGAVLDKGWPVWQYNTPALICNKDELCSCIDNSIEQLPAVKRALLTLVDVQEIDVMTACDLLKINQIEGSDLLHSARKKIYHSIDQYHRQGAH